jgi:probable F420-dependent oxidoreductase
MKIDGSARMTGAPGDDLRAIPERARALEQAGLDGLITAETAQDPFLPLLLAAEHTERLELLTSIAVAFARTPMTLAHLGHDLNAFSRGRFLLGLGSQIQPHIEKRFSMPWSHPAPRMREFILALRAIWACWYEGRKLDFRGQFYTHTLMTPMFTPTDGRFGAPRVLLAAVGPHMTEVAGEVADGVICHAFTTRRYLTEVTLPALARGLAKAGKLREQVQVALPPFVVSGANDEARAASRKAVARQIAFYGSTPAYRPVLDLHGFGELQPELNTLSKRGEWEEMGRRIPDALLEEFAVVAEPGDVAPALRKRFGGLVDRLALSLEFAPAEQRPEILGALRRD